MARARYEELQPLRPVGVFAVVPGDGPEVNKGPDINALTLIRSAETRRRDGHSVWARSKWNFSIVVMIAVFWAAYAGIAWIWHGLMQVDAFFEVWAHIGDSMRALNFLVTFLVTLAVVQTIVMMGFTINKTAKQAHEAIQHLETFARFVHSVPQPFMRAWNAEEGHVDIMSNKIARLLWSVTALSWPRWMHADDGLWSLISVDALQYSKKEQDAAHNAWIDALTLRMDVLDIADGDLKHRPVLGAALVESTDAIIASFATLDKTMHCAHPRLTGLYKIVVVLVYGVSFPMGFLPTDTRDVFWHMAMYPFVGLLASLGVINAIWAIGRQRSAAPLWDIQAWGDYTLGLVRTRL